AMSPRYPGAFASSTAQRRRRRATWLSCGTIPSVSPAQASRGSIRDHGIWSHHPLVWGVAGDGVGLGDSVGLDDARGTLGVAAGADPVGGGPSGVLVSGTRVGPSSFLSSGSSAKLNSNGSPMASGAMI